MENKPIQINDSLIAIQVPKEFDKFRIARSWADGSGLLEYYNIDDDNGLCTGWNHVSELEDDEENYQIIGLVQTPEIKFDFDVLDEWVEILNIKEQYMPAKYSRTVVTCLTKEDSFRSRIEKAVLDAGMSVVNNETHPADIEPTSESHYNAICDKWQKEQDKVIDGNLLIIQKL